MAGKTTDFFSSKHKKLLWISTWANILAWIALIVYALITLMTILSVRSIFLSLPPYQSPPNHVLLGIDLGYLEIVIRLITRVLNACFPGIVFWLVLKGISVGLKMITETDINYREIRNEEVISSRAEEQASDTPHEEPNAEENDPVFYEPQEVWKIVDQLSRLAIIAVFVTIIINIPQFSYVEALIRTYWMHGQAVGYLSWLIAIFLVVLVITVGCKIAYFAIHALASILDILMEMEYNSRNGVTS